MKAFLFATAMIAALVGVGVGSAQARTPVPMVGSYQTAFTDEDSGMPYLLSGELYRDQSLVIYVTPLYEPQVSIQPTGVKAITLAPAAFNQLEHQFATLSHADIETVQKSRCRMLTPEGAELEALRIGADVISGPTHCSFGTVTRPVGVAYQKVASNLIAQMHILMLHTMESGSYKF